MTIYYSTIPLDFYLDGSGSNPRRDNLTNIYAPNMLAYVGGLHEDLPSDPEPNSLALLATGALSGLGLFRRRRK